MRDVGPSVRQECHYAAVQATYVEVRSDFVLRTVEMCLVITIGAKKGFRSIDGVLDAVNTL